jgi:hypothetical protein
MHDNEREYNINGLTSEEVQMLEMMWSIESSEDMEDWLTSLTRKERLMAYRLRMLLLIEMIDYDAVQDLSVAKDYLKKFQLNI